MDYTQLAQAKAEKKYPFAGEAKRPTGSQNEYTQSQQDFDMLEGVIACKQEAYIDALNDVQPLVNLAKQVLMGQNGELKGSFIARVRKLAKDAIEQFEKIEPVN